jgi:hypothetical protein
MKVPETLNDVVTFSALGFGLGIGLGFGIAVGFALTHELLGMIARGLS